MIDRECCGGRHGRSCDNGRPLAPLAETGYLAHEIGVQRQMTADLIVGNAEDPRRPNEYGPLWPCGIDAATGKPYNLGELFDLYALAMLCVDEVMQRAAKA
jgi:hypothetical protein